MPHIGRGDRAYVVDSDSFADVERTTFLGKEGSVLLGDDGLVTGLGASETRSRVVNKSTSENGLGETVELPMDVKVEGVSILQELSVDPEQHRLMFAKFMVMFTKEQRRAYVEEWKQKRDDPVQKTLFLNGMIQALDDDEVFVAEEGKKALVQVDPDVQKKMFEKFLTTVDRSTRQRYILEWLVCKNDKDKKDAFLQKMYELLMEDDDYIVMEGRKALDSLSMSLREQQSIFSRFLRVSSAEERREHVAEWRRVRKSRSRRAFFLKNFIGLVTSAAD